MATDTEKSLIERGFEDTAKLLEGFGFPDLSAEAIAEMHAKWLTTGRSPRARHLFLLCAQQFEMQPQIYATED